MSNLIWRVAMCNVRGINISAKQENVVHWHFDSGNLISVVTETKLRFSTRSWIADKFDRVRIFSSGLDVNFLGAGMTIIMNNSLIHHVSKVEEVPGHFISVRLLFKGKLLVSVLGLYAGASAGIRFGQASKINFFIAKTVNSSIFVVLSGDFNKDSSRKSASFKFCSDLGLVNLFGGHSLIGASTWSNSRGVEKVIDFIFVSEGLSAVITGHSVASVQDFFNTDYKTVSVSIGLSGFLNACLNSVCKQANKDRWKFRIKDAGIDNGNLDVMWEIIREVVTSSADKVSSVIKLIDAWSKIDVSDAAEVCVMVNNSANIEVILRHLSGVRKKYHKSKYFESRVVRDAFIRKAIDKCIENFCSNKGCMIKSVLEHPFQKVVLDHLIIGDNLILKSGEVKSIVDGIMEDWTRKHVVSNSLPFLWLAQYAPLVYVDDCAFSAVMCNISSDEFFKVFNDLPDGKSAELFGIPNELWKHGDLQVLSGLLDILNTCLVSGTVPKQ
ncbi:hypothetical protein G9A89_017743 [Geosiphon pyriformis]|nr:hypothetical protein G9A89_017743 [Geosiphon pyriformis]